MIKELRLAPDELRRRYDPGSLGFQSTSELEPLKGIMGQHRALAALQFGLGMQQAGFNIYVSGARGIGKMTAVRRYLDEVAEADTEATSQDLAYVNNFEDPYQPRALVLPGGMGRKLAEQMSALIEHARREVPRAFDSEEYRQARRDITAIMSKMQGAALDALDKEARQANHSIKLTPMGIIMTPVLGERDLSETEIKALPESARDDIKKQGEGLEERIHETLRELRGFERKAVESRRELDRAVATYVVGQLMDEMGEEFEALEGVKQFLDEVREDMLERIDEFKREEEEPDPRRYRDYEVNVIVDRSKETEAPPLVVERNPSYVNLFGRIEKEGEHGSLYTDFSMIRAGSIHRANGGYLVLKVEDLLRNLFSWDALKRALNAGRIEIEEPAERLGITTTKTLQPEPVALRLKVLLVGPPLLYYLLHRYDPDFPELFKVKADFQTRIDATAENRHDFFRFLAKFSDKEDLLPLDAGAAARLLEHSTRQAGDREKLSALFGELCDVVREAQYWARAAGVEQVTTEHLEQAIEQQEYRSNLLQERIQEAIAEGTLRIETEGEAVGQVNGLSVISLDKLSFGRPSRISATSGPGREGIVDIERKAELGGALHTKGVMILHGFLLETYARERPLSLSARLAFEQSYSEIDGDSASCAELYALISSIAQVPIRQGIAVTGSIDQHGRVQAIGGANEKIEGFFEVCRAKGLTGEQGVLIPRSNLRHLMLKPEVVAAVAEGQFNVWAVSSINEGLEVLTGMPAGERDEAGEFPEGCLNARVTERLEAFSKSVREKGEDDDGDHDDEQPLIQIAASTLPGEG